MSDNQPTAKEVASNLKAVPHAEPVDLSIRLGEDGVFRYHIGEVDGRRVRLSAGQLIRFNCDQAFFIAFKGLTPFTEVPGQPVPWNGGRSLECTVSSHAHCGVYHYTVAAFDGRDVWIDDPEVVIIRSEHIAKPLDR